MSKQKIGATLKDAVYGAAVGDALGVPFEFKPRGSFTCYGMTGYGTHSKEAGTWSDDTSMMLAICDSIRELGNVDVDDIRRKFEDWFYNESYTVDGIFDYGATTAVAIQSKNGIYNENSCGNGSLMRTIPLVFAPCNPSDVREVSAITHAHPLCMDICAEYVTKAWQLSKAILTKEELGLQYPFTLYSDDTIKSGGYVVDTFNAAIWCFVNTDNYRDCVLKAVNLGGDTDTTACVAGGLAGLYYGMEDIPKEWIDTLKGKDLIDACLF